MDAIDKKILIELMKNSKAPISKIAKIPRLTREIVRHRIPKLIELGFIKSFIARIHQPYFCAGVANLTLKLINFDSNKHHEIIQQLKHHKKINWISELCGTVDLMCTILYQNLDDLSDIISEITNIAGKNLQDHQLSMYIGEIKFNRIGLITENSTPTQTETEFSKSQSINLSKEDLIILRELAKNCRIKNNILSSLAKISEDAVRIKIKRLEKIGVIRGYTILLNPASLGYESYQVGIQMEKMNKKTITKIKHYVNQNPYITFCVRTSGKYNLMLAIEVKNRTHFKELLQNLRTSFSEEIRNYEFQMSLTNHKEVFIPEGFI
ncbi:Lrp/AsnC family transcriptional regulator [Candidatus Woesearchaeota archaeon]|jgi:Lrp/AsnC family transcriptional regulator, leucine-responsive regulatory protein|nr:Lrp/AsnC family transcriptional regulator [Candidatus Woesearchaeota archaeon]